MSTLITVIQVLLGFVFAVGGFFKLAVPYAKYTKLPTTAWANDFQPEHIRLLCVTEVCAAVGLIVPLLLHRLTILMPLAAVGLALYMSGAMATHLRRAEYGNMAGNLLFLGLALFVAYGRLAGLAG